MGIEANVNADAMRRVIESHPHVAECHLRSAILVYATALAQQRGVVHHHNDIGCLADFIMGPGNAPKHDTEATKRFTENLLRALNDSKVPVTKDPNEYSGDKK